MLVKSCRRCGRTIPYPLAYCEECRPAIEEQKEINQKLREQRYNKKRSTKADPKYRAFYRSQDWITLARVYLQDHEYHCEDCKAMAAEVHHVVPIQTADGWLRRLDYDNLRALCIRCHNKAHDRFTVQ
ncbi:HNH endonuclease [Proteiniclasticum sp. BAD-10]|uniref:HNH endonuclease n=1 Tax=Proteiniclasticum sediminis TaxID=2804028 RepID=A0A941CN66_9CLOT|nr:HNH endonuclease signature motif containing protein [Proteiniclasticum sediminis]MBR0575692.1 HNH endonuclease [Proteiniclasticum sediminis]